MKRTYRYEPDRDGQPRPIERKTHARLPLSGVPAFEVVSTREQAINKLMWNHGGYGYGICALSHMMIQGMMEPSGNKPDWVSIVAISGPPEKYTDEELFKLVEFSARATADYDTRWTYRMGCVLIIIDKCDFGGWIRKRQTWEYGSMWSPTLDDAIKVMEQNTGYGRKSKKATVWEPLASETEKEAA